MRAACGGNDALYTEVASLISSDEQATDVLETPDLGSDLLAPSVEGAAAHVGERIGAYRAVEVLGRGGMGTVYLAERADEQFTKQVAINTNCAIGRDS